jgi:hypothetical protein
MLPDAVLVVLRVGHCFGAPLGEGLAQKLHRLTQRRTHGVLLMCNQPRWLRPLCCHEGGGLFSSSMVAPQGPMLPHAA